MAAPTDTAPSLPTTVKPFEMSDDDDDVQETGVLSDSGTHQQPTTTTSATSAAATTAAPTTAASASAEEPPPTKPSRPVTEQQKNEAMLKEAFPSIELSVIKAVLIASGGRIDPAFNALLGMSDPDAVQNDPVAEEHEVPPPQPPRPTGPQAQMSQVEADELYARQLAEHYDNVGAYENRTSNRGVGYEREPNFIDDELPVIRENLRKGFVETQTKVNSWFTNLKKRIDGEYDSEEDESQPSRRQQQPYRRSGEGSRRSNDYDRYDADPQVLSDDFAGIRLNQDGSQGRTGNPNLYQPPPRSTHSRSPRPDSRKVSFQEGHENIDVYDASPKLPPKDNAPSPGPGGNKPSKWQPMSTVEPDPITEHDPFSLGDSEDEREAKDSKMPSKHSKMPSKHSKTESKDIKMDDAERLKQATADAMADSLMDESAKKGEEAKKV
ncbi:ubiquitin-binding protein CUE5 [Apiospora phragmitis]|uniref:Ubiquitin-binding protein CUE5 n=1 Tax=Apiospora phragmitis TaxID=2905665 RepID=A0ABR1WT39_9PEZI